MPNTMKNRVQMSFEGVDLFVTEALRKHVVGSNLEAFLNSPSTIDYFFSHSGFEWVRKLYLKKKKNYRYLKNAFEVKQNAFVH